MEYDLKRHMLPAPRAGGFRMEGYWVWCGSVIKGEDGRYHMFASRWPKTQPMHPGWLLQSEVVRAVSDTPEGPYAFQEVVLPARGPEYWDGRATHNPHIMKQGDTYVLYYMGTTNPFADPAPGRRVRHEDPEVTVARSNKRIGVATSKSVFGPWQRFDAPVLDTKPGTFYNFLASNPAPCFHADGSVTLVFKARRYNPPPYTGALHGPMTLGVAAAPGFAGPYKVLNTAPLFDHEMEDPFIWEDEAGLHLIAKDMTGEVCGEKFGGAYAHSADGVNWRLEKGKLAYSRTVLWDDGKTRVMSSLERPFLLLEEGRPRCLFFAASDGTDNFLDASDTWNMAIPLG